MYKRENKALKILILFLTYIKISLTKTHATILVFRKCKWTVPRDFQSSRTFDFIPPCSQSLEYNSDRWTIQ